MASKNEQTLPKEDAPKAGLLSGPRLLAAGTGLGGMVLGAIIGMAVQVGVESTGLLGPTVESLIAEQQANFTDVNARLDELKNKSTDKEMKASLAELGKLLKRQDELARQANSELAYLGEQVSALRDQQLAEAGFAGGADVWLKKGESINVGSRRHVFGLLRAQQTFADVNLDGTRKRLSVGDSIPLQSDDASCTVFYKQAEPRADGRVGFDLTCS